MARLGDLDPPRSLAVLSTPDRPVPDPVQNEAFVGRIFEALRALTYRAVESYVSGKDVTRLASMAKLKSGRLSREVADSCLQYWGGMGFTADNPISQSYRDGRLISIGGGADEIMLGIICKYEGTLPGKA